MIPPRENYRFDEEERECSYLPHETASLTYRLYRGLTPTEYESLLVRGWRRFGISVFRPRCADCTKCISLRVLAREFRPSKSQRRVLRKNETVQVQLRRATVTDQHIQLYNVWHENRTQDVGWRPQFTDPDEYAQSFLIGEFPSLFEMQYWEKGRLLGIGLVDMVPSGVSSAYVYYDPDWLDRSPGTFSALSEIQLAQRLGLPYVYLGYWITGCRSSEYKNRFRPYETLIGRPDDDETPVWIRSDAPSTELKSSSE